MTASPTPGSGDASRGRLEALIEASLVLNSSPDLGTLLARILDLATKHAGAERGALFVRDPMSGNLVAHVFHGKELERIEVKPGQGLAGTVFVTRPTLRIDDAYFGPRVLR